LNRAGGAALRVWIAREARRWGVLDGRLACMRDASFGVVVCAAWGGGPADQIGVVGWVGLLALAWTVLDGPWPDRQAGGLGRGVYVCMCVLWVPCVVWWSDGDPRPWRGWAAEKRKKNGGKKGREITCGRLALWFI
jgi:hypothetical protein